MALDYHKLKNWPFEPVEHTYTEKDTMLYALGLGVGADPLDENQLKFVYEKNLQALPTMAVVLGYPGFWVRHPDTGVDWVKVVHGEQGLRIHKPLPPTGTVVGVTRVKSIVDKGAGKGALVVTERTVTDKQSGELLATLDQVTFCRGDGGYSANGQPNDTVQAPRPNVPETAPDVVVDLGTRPESALIYRLSADPNPLHADPVVATAAGYARPILHGLATYGIAGHAILKGCGEYVPARLKEINARFSSPVYPGETIRTEMWRKHEHVYFRARVVERDVIVLSNGYAQIS
jgi:acyl dehydratase